MNGQAMGSQTVASTVALAGAGDEAAFAQLVATYHADMAGPRSAGWPRRLS